MSFEEYAALARQLAEQRRAGEQHAATESARRRDLHAAVDYLQQRLTAQGHRLDQLGRSIRVDQPPAGSAPGGPAEAAGWPGPPSGSGSASGSGFGAGPVTAAGSGLPSAAGSGPSTAPGAGDGGPDGAAGVPGRAGVGAYPELPAGEARLALPTAVSPAGVGVPAQRAAAVDPAVELELARRMADEADRHGQQAELLAQRPALLPTWSPLARAVAVYAACGAAAGVLVLALVLASGVGMVDGFTLGAWICAGLPAVAFFGGYLVLGRWGRPAMVTGTPPRYLPLGFLICFLLVPMAYCAYLLLVRGLR
ncbi:hypothetical protein [Micromonospora zamorensis]|uniref:hypothetical protein n=1 Tax=Micromonospora zamorensis TaxID=709883 RepID=UPI00081F9AF3|nr:hypothetical protein [Micromonospora zamorensis]SCG58884.1 hypothetical protein GA0070619_3897 [Micromonospora zamorensis]